MIAPAVHMSESFGTIATEEAEKYRERQSRLNPDLDNKTNAIQDEFSRLMGEMQANREKRDE